MDFKTGIVVFNNGAFGGAAKRMTNLYLYLSRQYPGKFYYFVNPHLYDQIKNIFKNVYNAEIYVIDDGIPSQVKDISTTPSYFKDKIPDPLETDKNTSLLRKIYWFVKNKNRQRKTFKKIEAIREAEDIKVFNGMSAGALPLMFYLKQKERKTAVVFSDMDSWFVDVHEDMDKLWYRKYFSYNFLLENSDIVDFLSPYIAEGIKDKGINIENERIAIAPCSFIDMPDIDSVKGDKTEIAFASRLEPDKNPMLYLEAAKIIIEKYPDIKFHILGEGTLVPDINEFIEKNDLSKRINFQFHSDPMEVFRRTSIFVSLQSGTNYPSQSVLEAMYCRNAIIASNTGDTHLFVNKDNGILIELNIDSLVNAMEKLINDREFCKKAGENGKKLAKNGHTIERYTEYYISILNKANQATA